MWGFLNMKPLLPTLKERKRYIVYELITQNTLKSPEKALLDHLQQVLGLFDGAKAGILPVKYFADTQVGILRCSVAGVDKVKSAFLTLEKISNVAVVPRVRGTSGILKKCERFIPTERTVIE
jgi:RNase P/RNase MRP subunit POP5